MKLVRPAHSAPFPTAIDRLTFRFEDLPRLIRRRVDMALAEYGLSRAQWRLLAYVLREEGLTQTELAARLELERATVGQAIDALEAKGLVARTQQPGDRRVWRIVATSETQALLPELRTIIDEIYARLFTGFTEAEVTQLGRFLERLSANAAE